MKDQSAKKGNLSQINAFLVAKQGFMGIRPNKTNFGLSFGHFWEQKCEEERIREEEERKGMKIYVWKLVLYGIARICME